MKVSSIASELNSLAYHGRGIIIGKSADGKITVENDKVYIKGE